MNLCSVHQKKAAAYCLTCFDFICVQCIATDAHKSHALALIEDVNEHIRTNLGAISSQHLIRFIEDFRNKSYAISKKYTNSLLQSRQKFDISLNKLVEGKHQIRPNYSKLFQLSSHTSQSALFQTVELIEKEIIKLFSDLKQAFYMQMYSFNKIRDLANYEINDIVHKWKANQVTLISKENLSMTQSNINIVLNDHADSIAYDQKIFVIGGKGPLDDTFELDLVNHAVLQKAHMLCKKYQHTLCKDNEVLYSVGGTTNNSDYLSDCQVYDVPNDKWAQLPNLLTPRSYCAAFVWFKTLYSYYGRTYNGIVSSVESYKSNSKDWIEVNLINSQTPRYSIHAITLCNGVLIMGGRISSNIQR